LKNFILPIEKLVAEFSHLPSVGRKTAIRFAYHIINSSEQSVEDLIIALKEAKKQVRYCSVCGNFTDTEVCSTCQTGDRTLVCVVAEPKDVLSLERVSDYTGTFHVLHGLLDPMRNITPNDLRIKELLDRVSADKVTEVVLATSPTVEGEATAIYLGNLLKPLNVKVTRIAQGISVGTDIEYVDEHTLSKAISDRREI